MYTLVQKIRTKALQLEKDGAALLCHDLFNTTKTNASVVGDSNT